MRTLFCVNCGWRLDGEVGMAPYCPYCQNRLNLLNGTKEEIDKHLNEKYPELMKEKELCPFCGGTGFKMITVYEGNSEFNTLSHTSSPCKNCNKEQRKNEPKNTTP